MALRKERGDSASLPHCQMYAIIREKVPGSSGTRNITVCGDSVREKTVYSSTGNSIEVTVMQMEGNNQKKSIGKTGGVDEALTGRGKTYFMLKYEGKGYQFAFKIR